MKTYLECIPCFIRQALAAARLLKADKGTQKAIMDEVAVVLPKFSTEVTPPEIARKIYRIVEKYTGGEDAYKQLKHKCNKMAMGLYADLKEGVKKSEDPLLSAVRLAVAGNVIDYGIFDSFDIGKEIEECLEKDFAVFDFEEFRDELSRADRVLYILDNAGEIVFDKILIEEMGKDVVCAVRGRPIINDVTMRDAEEVGLEKICKVISSGSDVPGTLPGDATEEFRKYYDNADVVISKGQGNFETLTDENRSIYFIFKAKCHVVASLLECELGDIILKRQSPSVG